MGLPGPSGTPGDGSLRSEQTLTIYKGDKVTEQGKARSRSAFTTPLHTKTHIHGCDGVSNVAKKESDNRFVVENYEGRGAVIAAIVTAAEGNDMLAQISEELKEEEPLVRGEGVRLSNWL